jgi:hypothetical protein
MRSMRALQRYVLVHHRRHLSQLLPARLLPVQRHRVELRRGQRASNAWAIAKCSILPTLGALQVCQCEYYTPRYWCIQYIVRPVVSMSWTTVTTTKTNATCYRTGLKHYENLHSCMTMPHECQPFTVSTATLVRVLQCRFCSGVTLRCA